MTLHKNVRHTLDAFLVAGVLLGALDFASGAATAPPQWGALPAGLALSATAGLAAGAAALLLALAAAVVEPVAERPLVRRALALISGLALALPLLVTIPLLAARGGGRAFWIVGAGAGAVFALALAGTRLLGSRSAWTAGALASAAALHQAAGSIRLFERADAAATGLFAAAGVAAALGTVALAWALARLLAGLTGERPGRALATATLLIGVAAAVVIPHVLPVHYAVPRRVAFGGALVLLALGAMRLPRLPLRLTAPAALTAVIGALLVPTAVRPLTPTQWFLSDRMPLSRELLASTGLLAGSHASLLSELRALPEAEAGRRAREDATAWNATRRPAVAAGANVLLVTIDSLRADRLGRTPAVTPNVDRLAGRSVRFRRAYAQGAWTCLSVPALMWSTAPGDLTYHQVLYDRDLRAWTRDTLPPGTPIQGVLEAPDASFPAPTLAEELARAALTTVAVPNDGFNRILHPRFAFTRGFSRVVYPPDELLDDPRSPGEITDQATMDLALRTLRELRSSRFFLWVHLFEPHLPNKAREGIPVYGYDGDAMAADRELGRLLGALDAEGLTASTVVVLTSDHGESLGEHDIIEHGTTLYEEAVRIPLLVAAPGLAPRDVDQTVGLVDVAPTVLSLLGLPIPPTMQGFDLTPALRGDPMERPPVTLETWRINARTGRPDVHLAGAVHGDVKVVFDELARAVSLFDLALDPGEEGRGMRPDAVARGRALAAWLVGFRGQ